MIQKNFLFALIPIIFSVQNYSLVLANQGFEFSQKSNRQVSVAASVRQTTQLEPLTNYPINKKELIQLLTHLKSFPANLQPRAEVVLLDWIVAEKVNVEVGNDNDNGILVSDLFALTSSQKLIQAIEKNNRSGKSKISDNDKELDRGNQSLQAKDYKEAASHFYNVIKTNRFNADAYQKLSEALKNSDSETEKNFSAIAVFRAALIDPTDSAFAALSGDLPPKIAPEKKEPAVTPETALINLTLAFKDKKYEEVVKIGEPLAQKLAANQNLDRNQNLMLAKTLSRLGDSYLELKNTEATAKNYASAIEATDKLAELNKDETIYFADFYSRAANFQLSQTPLPTNDANDQAQAKLKQVLSEYDKAVKLYESYYAATNDKTELTEKLLPININSGRIAFSLKDVDGMVKFYSDAIANYNQLEKSGKAKNLSESRNQLAAAIEPAMNVLTDTDKIDTAIEFQKSLVNLNPENSLYLSNLSRLYSITEQFTEADQAARDALTKSPDRQSPALYTNLCRVLVGRQNYPAADNNCSKALTLNARLLNPDDSAINFFLGFACLGEKKQDCEAFFQRAATQFETKGRIGNNKETGKLGSQTAQTDKFALLTTDDLYLLASTYTQLQNYPKAIEAYKSVLVRRVKFDRARFNLGITYINARRKAEVLQQLEILKYGQSKWAVNLEEALNKSGL